MELMSPKRRAFGAEGAGLLEGERAVAEMAFGFFETCRNGQEAGHGVALPLLVDQPVPQHHEPAAFTVQERAARGGASKPIQEGGVGGELAGMQLGIAAGQIDRIRNPRAAPHRSTARKC